MKILGISDSHEAHACGMIAKSSADIAREISRLKSDQGFPDLAINKALEIADISADEIDHVAVAAQLRPISQLV